MKPVFADTFSFLALLGSRDSSHERAFEFSKQFPGKILTTAWVLTELADAFSGPDKRGRVFALIDNLRADPNVTVVPASEEHFSLGLELYGSRTDKAWSLTDCVSFVVMQEYGLTEALTGDRHFEQAGFKALLLRT